MNLGRSLCGNRKYSSSSPLSKSAYRISIGRVPEENASMIPFRPSFENMCLRTQAQLQDIHSIVYSRNHSRREGERGSLWLLIEPGWAVAQRKRHG